MAQAINHKERCFAGSTVERRYFAQIEADILCLALKSFGLQNAATDDCVAVVGEVALDRLQIVFDAAAKLEAARSALRQVGNYAAVFKKVRRRSGDQVERRGL